MNQKNYGRYPKRRVLLADLASLVLAWFFSLMIRYDNWPDRFSELYISLIITMCLFRVIIFLVIDLKHSSIFEMDPVENLTSVLRDGTIIIVFAVIYLFASQRGEMASRLIIGMMYVMNVIFDFVLRMLLRQSLLRKAGHGRESHVITISYPYPDVDSLRDQIRSGNYDELIVYRGGASDEEYEQALKEVSSFGLRTYAGLSIPGYSIKSGIACDVDGRTSIPVSVRDERFELFGVSYAIARTEEAVLHVIRHLRELSGKYICFSNTHTLVMGRENAEYREVLNGAAFTFADGNPIARLQLKSGLPGAERVAGPDFMEHMFKDSAESSVSHYFYGAAPETLSELDKSLREKYPGIDIRGMYSPPYRELTPEEDAEVISRINGSGADIVWIGLGAPKQEKWMAAHKGKIKGVMMGVGAGFDFHAGTIRRAPTWMQKIGLEWLYRLFQDPGRLFKRYVVTNCKFYFYRIIDLFGRSGK